MNNEQQPGRVSSRAISGLPGPQGPQGLQGPAGPPGPGFTDVILRSHTETLENTTALSANVFCEPGEIALGGGASAAGPGNATLPRSQPIFVGTTATGWDAIALQDTPGTMEVTVFAICAKPVIPPNGG